MTGWKYQEHHLSPFGKPSARLSQVTGWKRIFFVTLGTIFPVINYRLHLCLLLGVECTSVSGGQARWRRLCAGSTVSLIRSFDNTFAGAPFLYDYRPYRSVDPFARILPSRQGS
jgi:hypothetical protein